MAFMGNIASGAGGVSSLQVDDEQRGRAKVGAGTLNYECPDRCVVFCECCKLALTFFKRATLSGNSFTLK